MEILDENELKIDNQSIENINECENIDLKNNKVICQANKIILGKQNLSTKAAKIIRAAILQIQLNDEFIKPYLISTDELSKILDIDKSNLYYKVKREIKDGKATIVKEMPIIEDIAYEISNSIIHIELGEGNWDKYHWVSFCGYRKSKGIIIKLNSDLKSYLLGLKGFYTSYEYTEIKEMKSAYAIRIYEMIACKLYNSIPIDGIEISFSVQQIREACGCENKLKTFDKFREKVLDMAVEEINKKTVYRIKYTYEKNGRKIVGIKFFIKSWLQTKDDEFPFDTVEDRNIFYNRIIEKAVKERV